MEETPQSPNESVDPPAAMPAAPAEPAAPTAGDDKNMAVLAHVLAIFFGFIPPLIIFVMSNDKKGSFVRDQSMEALNFQITLFFAYMIAGILSCVFIGLLLLPVIWLAALILCIMAALGASRGEAYRYPLTLRLIK